MMAEHQSEQPDVYDVLIVANPTSGSGRRRGRIATLVDALAARGLAAQTVCDLDSVSKLAPSCRCVVAAGGDGTVAAVVNAMRIEDSAAPTKTPGAPPGAGVAVLALGTENLLAKELGFIIEVDHLAAAIAAGRLRQIDLGRANGRYFILMLTAGIDAEIAHRLAHWRARPGQSGNVRHISYARHILASLLQYPFDPIDLTTDDGTIHRGVMAMVFSATHYGMGLRFVPQASIDDGLLHWLVLERPGRIRLLSFLTDVLRGRHLKRRDVQHGTARHVSLQSERPIPIQIDGDSAAFTPVKIDIHPQAFAVIDVDDRVNNVRATAGSLDTDSH